MSVQWCLSGKPRKLRERIKQEAFLTEELVIKREAERARERHHYSSSFRNIGDHLHRRSVNKSQTDSRL